MPPTVKRVRTGDYKVSYSSHRSSSIKGPHIPLKNYKQQDGYSCGFIAALTVARYYNESVYATHVLAEVRTTPDGGTSQKRIIKGLGKLGITADYREDLDINHLRFYVSKGIPVIITVWPDYWDGDHWVVVRGFDTRKVYLTNYDSLLLKDFRREWIDNWDEGPYGAGLICTRTERDEDDY